MPASGSRRTHPRLVRHDPHPVPGPDSRALLHPMANDPMKSFRSSLMVAGIVALAGGCTTQPLRVPDPLPLPADHARSESQAIMESGEDQRPVGLQRGSTPQVPGAPPAVSVAGLNGEGLPPLKGGAVNVNIEGMPVPAFINEFFGTILGTGFQMEAQVSRMTDVVTLRTPGPQSPQNFYRLATQILRSYGVATEYSSGLVFFRRATDTAGAPVPLIVSGRALPDVPISHRPVFQLVELQSVRVNDVTNLLRQAFKTDSLTIQDDINRNAVILSGKPEIVRQALEAIRVFDRPLMRGRSSARLEPAFVSSDELAKRLVEVLSAEGYGASLYASAGGTPSTAVLVLPLNAANTVLVFAADRAVLEHAVEWARGIDRPNPIAGSDGLFYYMVKNTQAREIADTITGVRSQSSTRNASRDSIDGSRVGNAAPPPQPMGDGQGGQRQAAGDGGDLSKGRLSVDEPRNALIYQGTATDWARILQLVQQMDRAPRQVMIEVTVAEVTLTDNQEFGVAWKAFSNSGIGDGRLQSGTLSGLGGTGLSYLLDIGRDPRHAQGDGRQGAGQRAVHAATDGQERRGSQLRRRHRSADHHLAVHFADPERGQFQHPADRAVPQDRHPAQHQAGRVLGRPGRPRTAAGGQRGAADRRGLRGQLARHLQPLLLHQPEPEGRQRDHDRRPDVAEAVDRRWWHPVPEGCPGARQPVQVADAQARQDRAGADDRALHHRDRHPGARADPLAEPAVRAA
ncbi:MAG: hypothetical protein E6R00_02675 [Gammaproteobacteria bacterium]|nr:MAG: hypothetical protein E6R00_02675 [Gammaproteobacteria bacterium]